MRVAVAGCCHGSLDLLFDSVAGVDPPPDLVVVCGDFQAIRDSEDLESMAVPNKYRLMGDFHKYAKMGAPFLTLVVGGNHEASRHMVEFRHGGWLAPNVYYIGDAGVVTFNGVRIGGLSGIYYAPDYEKPHFEKPPFDRRSVHSTYHIRRIDVERFLLLEPGYLDIMVSHDWPMDIIWHGNYEDLLRRKPFLRKDAESKKLGSRPGKQLLTRLQPTHWWSAHMHCFYTAAYQHENSVTAFMALDKVMPSRRFLEIVDIPSRNTSGLKIDPTWENTARW